MRCAASSASLPPKPGIALVIVQHLDPRHESQLTAILKGQASLPVVEATNGAQVETQSRVRHPAEHERRD